MNNKLKLLGLAAAILSTPNAHAQHIRSTSLDAHVAELKKTGSLTALCLKNPPIKECSFAIGEWKPHELESAKMTAPACFDQCMLDTFGFYKDPETNRDIPAVRTKDFDASAPSRGFEITFYPVAMRLFRYEGCAGCPLIYEYPTKITGRHAGNPFRLPILARGGYYIPSGLRRSIISSPSLPLTFEATTSKGVFIVNISLKALTEYSSMLRLLRYDQVN